MKTLKQFDGVEDVSLPAQPLHLAIGIFDGVHRGHRAVIGPAVEAAGRDGGIAAVLTFWPHPSVLFSPENPTPLMQNTAMKVKVLASLGVDAIITQPFTPEFAAVRAEDFVPWLKQRLPHLVAVYVGENFRFGHGRRGPADQQHAHSCAARGR
jgi:riboflavin kinase/FMN adenylyltransferase